MFGGREPEFVGLLETLGEAITIRDASDRLVYANQAALRHLGFETLDELRSASMPDLMAEYIVSDEHGRAVTSSDLPSVRALRGEDPRELLMHSVHRQTGQARWELLKTTVLHGADGRPSLALTMIEDLTALKTAERHMQVLSESGRIFASSLDPEQTLRNVAQAAVPDLADWCIVDLLDDEGRRAHVGTAHRDPASVPLVAALRDEEVQIPGRESALGRVMRSGEPELHTRVPDEYLRGLARSPEHLEKMRRLRIFSAMVVPMRVRMRTVGVMTFGTGESHRALTAADLEVASQLAARAGVAVENARLHNQLQRVSETLQQSLLPAELPRLRGWDIAALYRPAGEEQRIEVGGDFYEVFLSDDVPLLVMGDVTGHGVTAATVTALLRHGARFAARLEPHPSAILHRLDEELRQREETSLCTALCARLGDGELLISSAGHPAPLLVNGAGQVREVAGPGPLLGAFDDARWEEERVTLDPGELLLLFTDGVIEATGATDRFGSARLRRLLAHHVGSTPHEVLHALDVALADFSAGDSTDDIAALALRPRPRLPGP